MVPPNDVEVCVSLDEEDGDLFFVPPYELEVYVSVNVDTGREGEDWNHDESSTGLDDFFFVFSTM